MKIKNLVHYNFSDVEMTRFNGRIATEYKKLLYVTLILFIWMGQINLKLKRILTIFLQVIKI